MWSLYTAKDEFLKPLNFSNNKTQEDVVKEVLEAVNKGKKVIFIHGVCGTGKCLDKDSLVFCKPNEEPYFGYYKISELVGKEGEIFSLNGEGKIVISEFCNVRKTGLKKIYSLKTRTGREILASVNHPFLTITKKGIEWLSLEKLDEKSYICLPNKIHFEKCLDFDENKIKVLAHLVSEGKLGDKAGSPKYYQDKEINPKIRSDYEKALKKLFPEGEIRNEHKTEVTIVFKNMNTTCGTTNKLRLFIREFGLDGKKSKDKFVPKIIFNLNETKIALFLKTLFSGDGCIYSRKTKNKNEKFIIEYSSISKRLIEDVSLLLNRIGVNHTITIKKFRVNLRYCYRITISSQNEIRKFIEKIGFIGEKQEIALKFLPKLNIHKFTNIDKVPRIIREYLKNKGYNYTELDRFLNYEEIEKLRKNIGFKKIREDKTIKTPFVFNQQKIDFLREHIKKINQYIHDKTLDFICNENLIWDKIKSVNYVKEDETYDLEVPEYNNFIANGVVVHNSAIALNIARKLGKSSIIVPGKNLQNQYKKDYENEKYLLKDNREKLNIKVITGRQNHKCKFLEDHKQSTPLIKKEENLKLSDIFEGKREKINNLIKRDNSADNLNLPCKIEIKEKNWEKIKEYLKQNKRIDLASFENIKDVKRNSIAPVCPYWSPVIPAKYEMNFSGKSLKRKYKGVDEDFIFYQREYGCPFYEQFNSYLDSDVIVFNSHKYKIEFAIGRKPRTEVDIIDECDEFLDSFSNQRKINIDRLQNSLIQAVKYQNISNEAIRNIIEKTRAIKDDEFIQELIQTQKIVSLKETLVYDLIKIFLKSNLEQEIDEESYVFDVEETSKIFEDVLDDVYVNFETDGKNLIVNLVTINLAKKFEELVKKNKILVLMSGTLHSNIVLRDIFGISDYELIKAETQQQGVIEVQRTGLEMDCKYENFYQGKINRSDYLRALDKCIEIAKKPTLVHIQAFSDLPNEKEILEFKLNNLINREKISEMQKQDKEGKIINSFKNKEIDILFTTRCSRGMDFPGEQCNSIIFTKYPNPDVQDAFWKILKQTKPQHYWSFYNDKARRDLLQKIYRGLRYKEDHIFLLSPDERVLKVFENK